MFIPAVVLFDKTSVYNFALSGYNVVFITESRDPDLDKLPNKVDANILLPPYEVASLEIDGDYIGSEILYRQWLSNKECMDFINLIGLACISGNPIALYFGDEINDMKYPFMLLSIMTEITGIIFGMNGTQGSLDEYRLPIILEGYLMRQEMNLGTFVRLMPVNVPIPPTALTILVNGFKPCLGVQFPTMEDYNAYFMDFIRKSRMTTKEVYNPFVNGGPQ